MSMEMLFVIPIGIFAICLPVVALFLLYFIFQKLSRIEQYLQHKQGIK